jgi:hypothetical protein
MIEVYFKKDQEPSVLFVPDGILDFYEVGEANVVYTFEFKALRAAENAARHLRNLSYHVEGPGAYGTLSGEQH